METLIVVLLIVGLFLIGVELIVPGFGIFGILGALSLLTSWAVTIFTFKLGIFIVALEIVILYFAFYFIWKYIRKRQLYSNLILFDTLKEDKRKIGNMEYFVNKEGICKTDLRPFGNVDFNGMIVEVLSDDGFVRKNSIVKATKFEDNKLYVKCVNSN